MHRPSSIRLWTASHASSVATTSYAAIVTFSSGSVAGGGAGPRRCLRHSDRGSQYVGEQFQGLLADHGIVCPMSQAGNVWDNAAMESFFSSLKTERTGRKTYRTRDEARADVFDYIELFYNAKRRHSTIGYLSPMEFERQAGFA